MKKILSFVLVLAMIASMMCISVSAATCDQTDSNAHAQGYKVTLTEKQKLDHVVGKRGHTGENGDGAESANGITDAMPIQASIEGSASARYAVDLEYTSHALVITNNAVWDVNTLTYTGTMNYSIDGVDKGALSNTVAVEKVGEFKVTNYSNEPVYIYATVTDRVEEDAINDDGITTNVTKVTKENSIETVTDDTIVGEAEYDEIKAVKTKHDNDASSPVVAYYQAELTNADWVGNLWDTRAQANLTIASITFTVTSVVPTNNSTSSNPGEQA